MAVLGHRSRQLACSVSGSLHNLLGPHPVHRATALKLNGVSLLHSSRECVYRKIPALYCQKEVNALSVNEDVLNPHRSSLGQLWLLAVECLLLCLWQLLPDVAGL